MTTSSRLAAHRLANGRDPVTGSVVAALAATKAPTPTVAALAPARPATAAAPVLTQADVAIARQTAQTMERERVRAVFASDASRGRERACATLLAHSRGWSAQEIVAQLPGLPTDGEARSADPAARAASVAAWDRAWNGTAAPTAKAVEPSGSAAVWDKANANVAADRSLAGDSSDAWAKAYSRGVK